MQVEQLAANQPKTQQADILIVDDIPDNIRFLSSFLLEQGYQVRKAISGQMALKSIQALPPNLILLDVNLPDITGYEVCAQLKQNPLTDTIPILFLSAGNEEVDKVKAFQLGASDYITKPFYLEEVLGRIQTQLTIQKLQKDLKEQNYQLKQALEQLKLAQVNIVQQEKMATLRKVVAGVAHEINNPVSFIACNIQPIQEYINHLFNLIGLYQQKYLTVDPEIAAYLDEINLDFINSDLTKIINSMANGAERISTVVMALRIFTRLDEVGIKKIVLAESIENVLSILQHRLTARQDGKIIQVKKEFGKIPLITCYADQLNQVFFNLLCNAIDAIDEKISKDGYSTQTPAISIHTEIVDSSTLSIRIKDNGIGSTEEHKNDIFEPFFTTKPAGQGIGLGLSISRRIIEEMHHGRLTYHYIPNGETEFQIQIPT